MNTAAVAAIFKRDLKSYFVSLKGYMFVVAFVALAVLILFGEEFFVRNTADLALLNEPRPGLRLPVFLLLLVFFVPAITMTTWAQEKEQGTDQLLLTLPAHDHEVVLAKFLACFGVYTIALLFTLTNVGVIAWLGDPDWGALWANYLGYWLMGGAAIALGMLGSAMTRSLTTAWLLGAVLVGLPALPTVLSARADLVSADATSLGNLLRLWNGLGTMERFEGFGLGMVYAADVLYYVAIAAVALYANAIWLGRRHWTVDKATAVHGLVRLTCLSLSSLCLVAISLRGVIGADLSEAKMLSIRPAAQRVIETLLDKDASGERYKIPPVLIQAYISPKESTPDDYLQVRRGLIQLLKEIDRRAGEQVKLAIYDTDLYSAEAERAERDYGIQPMRVQALQGTVYTTKDIFLGLVFSCGPREVKIPFFSKGLPIQYELIRAIGSVAQFEKAKIGVLKTGVDLFGGFDFQSMRSSEDWRVLRDLRQQYEVKKVEGTAPISTDLKVLVVPLPSSLPQEELDRVQDYLYAGGHALFLVDPFPQFDINQAPIRPAGGGGNPFQQQRQPPSKPKGDIEGFLSTLGLTWRKDRVTWDAFNPHTQFAGVPEELIFVSPADATDLEGRSGFADDKISAGMQELALIFPGELEDSSPPEIKVTPLLTTRTVSGFNTWSDLVNEGFMGVSPKDPATVPHVSKGERRVLAVKLEGTLAKTQGPEQGQRSGKPFQAVVVADLDMISDTFYALRDQGATGGVDLSLDNVSFVSNAIDWLAGDETYLDLRKLRPKRRTLEALDSVRKTADEAQRKAEQEATAEAEKRLEEAQKRLDEDVEKLRARKDIDPRTKQQLVYAAQDREQRRLAVEKEKIEREKGSKVRLSKTEKSRQIAAKQRTTRWSAISMAVLPVLFLGLIVLFRKASLEGSTMDPARRRHA